MGSRQQDHGSNVTSAIGNRTLKSFLTLDNQYSVFDEKEPSREHYDSLGIDPKVCPFDVWYLVACNLKACAKETIRSDPYYNKQPFETNVLPHCRPSLLCTQSLNTPMQTSTTSAPPSATKSNKGKSKATKRSKRTDQTSNVISGSYDFDSFFWVPYPNKEIFI